MSHAHSWRDTCLITTTNPLLQFEIHFHSTRRDSCGRWLWRLVRRLGERRAIGYHFEKQCTSQPLPGERMPSSIGEQLPFCRLRMADEVAALPSRASTFQTHFRAAARPDLRPPLAIFPTAPNARTKQSSGPALVCSHAPTAAPPVISNRSHISTFHIAPALPDHANEIAERQR
jgi:hypothetical protein